MRGYFQNGASWNTAGRERVEVVILFLVSWPFQILVPGVKDSVICFMTISLFWDPTPITFKTRLSPKPFLWNEFYLYESKKLTWIEPRFKIEAWGDSKMVYSICWWFVFAVNGNSIENCQKAVLILPFAIVFLHSHCRLWCFSFYASGLKWNNMFSISLNRSTMCNWIWKKKERKLVHWRRSKRNSTRYVNKSHLTLFVAVFLIAVLSTDRLAHCFVTKSWGFRSGRLVRFRLLVRPIPEALR